MITSLSQDIAATCTFVHVPCVVSDNRWLLQLMVSNVIEWYFIILITQQSTRTIEQGSPIDLKLNRSVTTLHAKPSRLTLGIDYHRLLMKYIQTRNTHSIPDTDPPDMLMYIVG